MVQDIVHNLCESLVENIGGVTGIGKKTPPTPITYLTQWKLLGNSQVHTDPYLTQWKVEGNSVVDNNAILSCGDLGQDGKYHVKISNGVTIYDIPLTEPLRKVGSVADSIEFANGTAVVTRNIASTKWNDCNVTYQSEREYKRFLISSVSSLIIKPTNSFERVQICLSSDFIQNNAPLQSSVETNPTDLCMAVYSDGAIYIRDTSTTSAEDFYEKYGTHELLYRLATPTTEVIQVSPFPISATDTYTSQTETAYSAFEYKKNVEIWSCGEYNEVDGKYHILVQPLGGSIADIALDEPLRKWDNDYIDSIDYSNGVATLTRKVGKTTVVPDNITLGAYGVYDVAPIPSDILYETASYIRTKNNLYEDICNNDRGTSTNPPPRMYIGSAIHVRGTIVQQQGGSVNDYIQKLKDFYNNGGTLDILYKLATPTIEIIQVPQIKEAESYSCVISQGGKAVSWSSFETD